MSQGIRTMTMLGAAIIFIFGGITGFKLLTSTTASAETTATCTESIIAAGEELNSNAVTVNVFNASNRSGLANRVMINLQANGFRGGEIGNSTSAAKRRRVTILTTDRDDPAVKLIAAQFRDKVGYAAPDITVDDGIVIVVGDNFDGLKKKSVTKVKSDRELRICLPVVPVP